MTLRRHRALWVGAIVALVGSGCVLAPSVDADWADLEVEQPDDRLVYARSRQVEIGRNVWIGRAIAAVGAGLTATCVALWHDAEHRHEDGHDVSRAKRQFAWLGAASGGILLGGVGYTGYHETVRDDWALMILDQEARLGEGPDARESVGAPRAAGGTKLPNPTAPPAAAGAPPARVLYVEAGTPIPEWAKGVEVRTVAGPADPALAAVAQAVPAVKLPLLVVAATGAQPPTYAMGWTGIKAALEPAPAAKQK